MCRSAVAARRGSADSTPTSSFLTAVQKMTVYGDPAANTASATPVVTGLTTSNVNLTVTFTNGAPSGVQVNITGFRVRSYITQITLNGKPYVLVPVRRILESPVEPRNL